MATSAFVIYTTPTGELEGTLVSRMGGHVPAQLEEKFGSSYEAIVAHIQKGHKRGGFREISDDEPYWAADDEDLILTDIANGLSADYVFHVLPSGLLEPVEIVPSYKLVPVK